MKIILDTDMDSDCDDAAALAVLHALAACGEAEILAVGTTTDRCVERVCEDLMIQPRRP